MYAPTKNVMMITPMNARSWLEVGLQVAPALPCASTVAPVPAPPALLHQLHVHFGYSLLPNACVVDSPPLYRAMRRQAYVTIVQKPWARHRYVYCRVLDPPIGLRFFPVRSHEVIVVLQWWFRNRWEARLQS